mgnify:CR=1 FL=1
MKVGFIGLGKMGAGICSNIVKNGIDVEVYDINPANMQKFVDMGASSAATVKELAAQVDVCSDPTACLKTSPKAACISTCPPWTSKRW